MEVETFVALRLWINSWRWKDVPFYIRAGKRLATTATDVVVKLRQAPAVFTELAPPANYFRFRVTPTHTIAVGAFVKVAGEFLRALGIVENLGVAQQRLGFGVAALQVFDVRTQIHLRFVIYD